ncbi:MAG TPA: pyroglutamyl-peptidase I [Nocardioidaceae bacterium]|nr:pyroglutamyl-peptidase I [Nocardioidaceae bacterium]
MTLLVTGFEPFGGDQENASQQAVLSLDGVARGILPVAFGASFERLRELVQLHRPTAVVCVGEAGLRTHVCVERRARNLIEARIPDNAGAQPHDEPIEPSLGEWLETPLDTATLAGADAVVSDDAGLFVCNYVYFKALAELEVPAVFVHVPAVRSTGEAGVGAETDAVAEDGALPSQNQVDRVLRAVVDRLVSSLEQTHSRP